MPNFLGTVDKMQEPRTLNEMAHDGVAIAVIAGHLGKDPEFRLISEGKQLAKFSVAVSWGKRGTDDQRTLWMSCVAWEREARIMERFTKGDAIMVMGKPTVRQYKDQEYAELRVYSIAAPIYKDGESTRSAYIGESKQTQRPVSDSKQSEEPSDIPF